MNRKRFLKRLGIGIVAVKAAPEVLAPEPTASELALRYTEVEELDDLYVPANSYADLLEPGLSKIWRKTVVKGLTDNNVWWLAKRNCSV